VQQVGILLHNNLWPRSIAVTQVPMTYVMKIMNKMGNVTQLRNQVDDKIKRSL
jgi:hypothetical protein